MKIKFIVVTLAAFWSLYILMPDSYFSANAQSLPPTPTRRAAEIVGGQPAAVGAWPWQVLLRAGPYLCGGSLLSPNWVVTAAHCLFDSEGTVFAPSQLTVVLGEHNRSRNDGMEQYFAIQEVIIHENFNDWSNNHDIALLKLDGVATLNARVTPIQPLLSPTEDGLAVADTMAVVTGWGSNGEGGIASVVLMEVGVPIVDNEVCNRSYGLITDQMLCAGYAEGGKDSCQGDSGGPLVVPDQAGGWRLAGIVSFGYGCARPNYYGVYTRVSNYVDWIEAQTGGLATPEPTPTPTPTLTPTPPPKLGDELVPDATVVVLPEEPASLTYRGRSADIAFTIPQGAVATPTTLFYSHYDELLQRSEFSYSIIAFALSTTQTLTATTEMLFQKQLTVTVNYTESNELALYEEQLTLFSLTPPYNHWSQEGVVPIFHDRDQNRLVVEIDRPAFYAVGAPNVRFWLPLVVR